MENTEVKFGLGQIGNRTPSWAKWMFRVFFYISSMTTLYLSMFTKIPMETKLQISEIIAFANLAMHSFSKLFGVDITDYEKEFK